MRIVTIRADKVGNVFILFSNLVKEIGMTPSVSYRPMLGLKPTIPFKDAGILTDPPVSVPSAASHIPRATATADPVIEGVERIRITK